MPEKQEKRTSRRAHKKLREGKSPKTAARPFVHQEIKHYEQGKHGQSRRQAIATEISKARRHGIPYPGRGQQGERGRQKQEKTKAELYEQAKKKKIKGRSKMDKEQLKRALRKAA